MARTLCVYCREKGTRAKEHVFPAWLLTSLGRKRDELENLHISGLSQVVSRRPHSLNSLLLGNVCDSCNNGWMERNETDARPLLERLMAASLADLPQVVNVKSAEARAVSLWATKVAVNLNRASNYKDVVPAHVFTYLHDHRQPPPLVRVDACFAHLEDNLNYLQSEPSAFLRPVEAPSLLVPRSRGGRFTIGFQIRRLILRVMGVEGGLVYVPDGGPEVNLWPALPKSLAFDSRRQNEASWIASPLHRVAAVPSREVRMDTTRE